MPRKKQVTEVTENAPETAVATEEKATEAKTDAKPKKKSIKETVKEVLTKGKADEGKTEESKADDKKSAKEDTKKPAESAKGETENKDAEKKDADAAKKGAEKAAEPEDKLLRYLEYRYRNDEGTGYSPAKRRRVALEKKLKFLKENVGNPEFVGKMYVDYADGETGDLAGTTPEGIDYVILADDVRKLFPKYVAHVNAYLLGAEFTASIKEVSDQGVVFLDPIKCSVTEAEFGSFIKGSGGKRQSVATQLEKVINAGISKRSNREKPVLRGEAVKVEPDCIYVDVFNTGIIAIVTTKHFARRYHRDLREVVQVGDTMRGIIYGRGTRKNDGDKVYYQMNTTYHMAEDGWKRAQNFKKGDTIVVRCVGKPEKVATTQQYFWGVSLKMPGIDLMGDFSTKVPEKDVVVGGYYKCKIKKVDNKQKQVKVVPFMKATGWSYDESSEEGLSF